MSRVCALARCIAILSSSKEFDSKMEILPRRPTTTRKWPMISRLCNLISQDTPVHPTIQKLLLVPEIFMAQAELNVNDHLWFIFLFEWRNVNICDSFWPNGGLERSYRLLYGCSVVLCCVFDQIDFIGFQTSTRNDVFKRKLMLLHIGNGVYRLKKWFANTFPALYSYQGMRPRPTTHTYYLLRTVLFAKITFHRFDQIPSI